MGRQPRRSRRRLGIQLLFTALTNGYWKGFVTGRIYTGATKGVCLPGLNCYSCPGALGSCPLGALQNGFAARGHGLSFYALGFLLLTGALLGRLVCGFLCPFGLVQDLLYRIPVPKKWKRLPGEPLLRALRWVVLLLLVLLLPMLVVDLTGLGKPWFCAYLCPSGTLSAGVPLVLANQGLRQVVGWLYAWKVGLLLGLLVLSVFLWRPFCRYLCPLGALYGLCNPISLVRYRVDAAACTQCGTCHTACALDLSPASAPNSTSCVRCGACRAACPQQAIQLSHPRIRP